MRHIGYGKLGRSMPLTLEKCKTLGGDVEMVAVVKVLAERHPNCTFHLLGRNSGEDPRDVGLPANVINPAATWGKELRRFLNNSGLKGNLSREEHLRLRDFWDKLTAQTFARMDHHIWWAGQHGTSNSPIPMVDDRSTLTKPQDWCAYYSSYITRGINAWRAADPLKREEIWLNADPRNYLKLRDLKWPLRHPVLTQYNYINQIKHERYGDPTPPDDRWSLTSATAHDGIWTSKVSNVYARLEINGLADGTPFGNLLSYSHKLEGRRRFGLFINEARAYVNEQRTRKTALREYVLPLNPDFIHGTWSDASQRELGVTITSAPWSDYVPLLQSVRYTLTTPSSGSGWATTKPWEAFAVGTVCFFHPLYDTQNNILYAAPEIMRHFLRVKSPEELRYRMAELDQNPGVWRELIEAQRDYFIENIHDPLWLRAVEERIFG